MHLLQSSKKSSVPTQYLVMQVIIHIGSKETYANNQVMTYVAENSNSQEMFMDYIYVLGI